MKNSSVPKLGDMRFLYQKGSVEREMGGHEAAIILNSLPDRTARGAQIMRAALCILAIGQRLDSRSGSFTRIG